MDIERPEALKKPFDIPLQHLFGAGPSNCSPRVLNALAQPLTGILQPETFQLMDDVKEGIKYVFQTRNEVTLALSTSGHGGIEAVFCNLIEPQEKVLIAVNGVWGTRAAAMAERYGAKVINIVANLGNNFSYIQLENAIQLYKPKLLFIVQGESSLGVYQPLEGLGDICHRHDCLLAVDTVASLGGTPMFADQWGIDVIYTGTQKVLGVPPGLAPISFSPRATQILLNRKTPCPVFYLDIKVLGNQWNCFGSNRIYHHTISTSLLYALREGLAIIAEEGLKHSVERHYQCAQRLYKGLKRIGLEPFVEEEHKRLPTVTTINVPEDVDWKEITTFAKKHYNTEISAGLGPSADKVIRVGVMGYNATLDKVDFILKVLEEALQCARSSRGNKL